jgi:hypothetical protein
MEDKPMIVPPSQQSAQRPAEKPGEPADLAWQGSTREYKGTPKKEDKVKASITWQGSQDATGGVIEFQGVRFEQNRSLISESQGLIEACQNTDGFRVDMLDEGPGAADAQAKEKASGPGKPEPGKSPEATHHATPPSQTSPPPKK